MPSLLLHLRNVQPSIDPSKLTKVFWPYRSVPVVKNRLSSEMCHSVFLFNWIVLWMTLERLHDWPKSKCKSLRRKIQDKTLQMMIAPFGWWLIWVFILSECFILYPMRVFVRRWRWRSRWLIDANLSPHIHYYLPKSEPFRMQWVQMPL